VFLIRGVLMKEPTLFVSCLLIGVYASLPRSDHSIDIKSGRSALEDSLFLHPLQFNATHSLLSSYTLTVYL
jgi:hypothetical protein